MSESTSNGSGMSGRVRVHTGQAIARAIRFVVRSSKIIAEPGDYAARLIAQQPVILAQWHGQFMLTAALSPPGMRFSVMVARHDDAELLASVLENFGVELIRGAGAGDRGRDRGGAAALRASLRALRGGRSVVMTADVPPGPARRAGLGIVTLARMSGRPIVPVAIATSRYRSFATWSRMTVNLPYSKLGLVVGEPIWVSATADEFEMEEARRDVEHVMTAVTARAYALAGSDPARATPPAVLFADPSVPPRDPGFALATYRAAASVLRPVAPVILSRRARRHKEDLSRLNERLGQPSTARPSGRLVWFHAASVGEMNAVLPLMKALRRERPAVELLLTTGTVTSAELAASRAGDLAIHQYIPLDAPQFVRSFLDHWQPDLAVFTESEIWPNLILDIDRRDIPLVLVNARMSPRSFKRWRKRPSVSQPLFGRFDLVLAQNERLTRRFSEIGARNVLNVGNLKLDSPPPTVDAAALEALRSHVGRRPILLAVSTHPGEDEIIADAQAALRGKHPELLTIIAPRHPERGEAIAGLLASRGLSVRRRASGELPQNDTGAYVADTMGELGTLYSLSPLAFVGGSLVAKGGQNPVEAIKLNCGVLTGHHWDNFRDVYKELLRRRAVREIHSADEMAGAFAELLDNPAALADMVARASTAVDTMTGALQRTIDALATFLPADQGLRHAS